MRKNDDFPLRPPEVVMDIERLGSMHQSRLSFMRALMRRMMAEQWCIELQKSELDEHGYGAMVYRITANKRTYSYVLFSDYLADEDRNDRVIAEKWDVTMALCIGEVSDDELEIMRANVPKQEAGRANAKMMVLSRGNKSTRNFSHVVDQLSQGLQPDPQVLAKVGYLYRTTAVYGSGKFGMADWQKVRTTCPEFAYPFAAEMFNCFMLRHFSLDQVEHLARIKSPKTAVPLHPVIKRYIGIGNSTGLGMAPYLVRHPKLISQWVLTREKALAQVLNAGQVTPDSLGRLSCVLEKAIRYMDETQVPDPLQTNRNKLLRSELAQIKQNLSDTKINSWSEFLCVHRRRVPTTAQYEFSAAQSTD